MKQEDLQFFKEAVPFWDSLSDEQQESLENEVSYHIFPAGTVIHGGNIDLSGLFLVKTGQVRAYIISETGKEITLYHLFDRDICIFSASCVMK
ncbi:MAG: cyclic nucleotide-binding domain-containing protein, partial [Eubacteriales bacterium]|nr:cyclic nucleotide-binding domain-containing protein [Eubacteriales bacterium]